MTRFNETKVDTAAATVEVGAGLTWDQVYPELESYRVNVVGGRLPRVGVAGSALGGGKRLQSAIFPPAMN
jgi:FAD/FMN-containing dehydrogenase